VNCIFCDQADPQLNRVLCENDGFFARFDNFPVSPGHIEIVPKRHVESLFDLSAVEAAEAFDLLRQAWAMLATEFGPDGCNVGINEGAAAGRTIGHLHIHLIPRYSGDDPDPRGGIRKILNGDSPDRWAAE
jgi:diadenosine tetraphosphate (Ap4A) HIT family hydrolase